MITVCCAIIVKNKKILITKRSEKMRHPLKWEFPGGKLKKNEIYNDCIKREIKEELELKIQVIKELKEFYFKVQDIHNFKMIPLICKLVSGNINLVEHSDYKWCSINELYKLDLLPVDISILEYMVKEDLLNSLLNN